MAAAEISIADQSTSAHEVSRASLQFDSGAHRCDAWLYQPVALAARSQPAIVMAHGLGAIKLMHLDAYARRFSAVGYTCLVFDYRFFGESTGLPRQRFSVRDQIDDWTNAVEFARALPNIDPNRIVIWGTSFGGGHVLTMAARDQRLAGAIAQCPFTDGIASSLAVEPVAASKVAIAATRDLYRSLRHREPVYVPLSGPPGSAALMTAPDSVSGMAALTEGVERYENRITARAALEILRYSPGRSAGDITCPLLVTLCEHDTIAPAITAQRQVARAPRAEIQLYPIGHYDIYRGDHFERAVASYLDFLSTHIPV